MKRHIQSVVLSALAIGTFAGTAAASVDIVSCRREYFSEQWEAIPPLPGGAFSSSLIEGYWSGSISSGPIGSSHQSWVTPEFISWDLSGSSRWNETLMRDQVAAASLDVTFDVQGAAGTDTAFSITRSGGIGFATLNRIAPNPATWYFNTPANPSIHLDPGRYSLYVLSGTQVSGPNAGTFWIPTPGTAVLAAMVSACLRRRRGQPS